MTERAYLADGELALAGSNLELKARVEDLESLRERLRATGAALQGVEPQEDRYFQVATGRLKLRVSSLDGAHLVAYLRPEDGDFRTSRFQRLPVSDPEGLAATLSEMLGSGPRVVKTREVWWWRELRIHLDAVESLGEFVEFEARLDLIGDADAASERLDQLCTALGISATAGIRASYGEMT